MIGYICITTINSELLIYKGFKIINIIALFITMQYNSLIFKKHEEFTVNTFVITLLTFYLAFTIKVLLSQENVILLIERYFDNIGIFAILIALSTVIILRYIQNMKLKYIKFISLFLVVTSISFIIFLESRTAIITLLSYVTFSCLKYIKQKTIKIISVCALCLFVIVLAMLIKQDSSYGRFLIWKTASYIIKDNPIYGVGYDNFASVYPIYQASMYETNKMSSKDIYVADNTKMALNEYIQITAELGFIGFVLLILIISTYVYYNYKYIYVYLCICISMFFSYILHSSIICYLLIVVLSLSYTPSIFKLNRLSSLIVLFLCMLLSVYSVGICLYKLNREKMISMLWVQSPDKLNIFYNINERYLCDNYKLVFKLAEYNYIHNNIDQSLMLLNQLDNTIIRNEIELLKGKCYIKKGDYNLAEKHLLLSVAICPNRFINRYDLFKLYLNNKMEKKAIEVAMIIHNMEEKVPSIHTMAIKNDILNYLDDKK
ncbi:MAG: O-antigen ligase family protein [bacterium]